MRWPYTFAMIAIEASCLWAWSLTQPRERKYPMWFMCVLFVVGVFANAAIRIAVQSEIAEATTPIAARIHELEQWRDANTVAIEEPEESQ